MFRSLLSVLALTAVAALPAQDDRDRLTPVGAIWAPSQSTAELTTLTNAGWRFTDLEIESTAPFNFTVSAVQNSGSYAKSWWYAIGVTAAQLSTTLATNNARLVDIEPYDDAGTTRFCAIMISNTGADAKSWWWFYNQTSTQVGTNVNANNGRLTCFERYTSGGVDRWATVMIANTGADARSWGYLFGASTATISTNLAVNGNRIYGLERTATDSYDTILVEHGNFGWWWALDQTSAQVTELLQQNIGRLVDVERRFTVSGTRYDVVLLDNANTLERTARQAFLAAAPGALGDYGFYLKEVNGPILAEMRADTVFEPCSTMKTVYLVHAMRRVALGLSSLSTLINKPSSCGVAGSNQTIEQTLFEMMEYSDNNSTLAIGNHYGLTNIDNTAAALGMASTNINWTIGCAFAPGPTENQMTLRDLTALHEQVANGYLGSQRAKFYELMLEHLTFPSWGTEDLQTRINAEAVALGLPNAVRDSFKNELHIVYKPGGIGWNTGVQQHYYFAEGGWMSVPFKDGAGTIQPREYTFGVFNYDFAVQEVSGKNVMSQAELELVWNRVKAAMATWDNHVSGQITTLVGAGCAGSSGTPTHSATGTAETGNTVNYRVTNAPNNALVVAVFGFDNATWNGQSLPFNLAPVGAPGCLLRINGVILDPTISNAFGVGTVPVTFANDPSLVGALLYTQFLCFDPPANALDFTITNAVRTTLGGWL